MVNIAVLVSGGGTNLQALINAQGNGILKRGRIVHVISSRSDAYALERAKNAGIDTDIVNWKELGDEKAECELLRLLEKYKPGVIVLAGFMHILSKDFITKSDAKIINVHPSLIPSFCGKGYYGLKVHEAVMRAGVKVTGATVHLVNEIPDGGKILAQKAIRVLESDTPERLQRRVMEQAEWVILPHAVEALCEEIDPNIFARPMKYPGRGIITGCTPSGRIMFAYFIMGRSETSRARIFERSGDDLVIKLTKKDKNFDPSLILYSPVRIAEGNVIVTNGDQTDTIYDALKEGRTFEEALRTREYEPDAPHYTPRISALISEFGYTLSILKRAGKFFFEYDFIGGKGHMIHTYNNDVMPEDNLPSFSGEPRRVTIPEDIDEFSGRLWAELDEDNKIALYVRYYDDGLREYQSRLFNKEQ